MKSGENLDLFFRKASAVRVLLQLVMCVVVSSGWQELRAQDNFRTQLFREADNARLRAKESNADVLAPATFGKGLDAYDDAGDAFQKGKVLSGIQSKIHESAELFLRAAQISVRVAPFFANVMTARNDAMSADALRAVPDIWNKAEAFLRSAATSMEDGNAKSALSDAGEAQGLYRSAELEATKVNYLSPAQSLLTSAENMDVKSTAPQTLERARKLLALADRAIQQNRYENSEARRLAEEAGYEAAHAIYLHRIITQMRAEKRDLEDVLLAAESDLAKMGTALNTKLRFDAGSGPAVDDLIAAVRRKDSLMIDLGDSVKAISGDRESLRKEVALLESKSRSSSGSDLDLLRKNEARRKHDQTVTLASMLFTPEDGTVIREGNTVIFRLYGIQFAAGKSDIEPQYSGVLSKIQRAVRMFPNCQVSVEAHTESGGIESANQRLSELRAAAVAAALRPGVPPATPISSQGFGSRRPITDNASPESRANNRRIEIVVTPEWAIVIR
jgi:OOP family OmpA-OmpF porin